MDIYGAQSHIKKLLSYVQDVSESDKQIYSKSKYKLREISDTCENIIEIIAEILKDQMFEESDNEFEGLGNNDISNTIMNIRNDIKTLPINNVKPSDLTTIQDKKKAIMLYSEILKQVSLYKVDNIFASNCADMIWTWFNCRFLESRKVCPDFRYSIYQIPVWIRNIVLWYGHHICLGDDNAAYISFTDWSNSILTDSSPSRYPLPYEIHDVSNTDSNYANLPSVVLWDILLDSGYIALCNRTPSEMYLTEDSVYRYCGEMQPDVLNGYTNYKQDSSILKLCGLDR